jgi:hypothetical protein
LFSSRDEAHNNAVVLKAFLDRKLKAKRASGTRAQARSTAARK